MSTTEEQANRFIWRANLDAPNGCWDWLGYRDSHGYPRLSRVRVHRALFELLYGPIGPLGLDHLCRNRGCINPDHLEPTTDRTNVLRGDGPAAVNARKTHCKKGHPFSPENTYTYHRRDGRRPFRTCRICQRRKRKHILPVNRYTLDALTKRLADASPCAVCDYWNLRGPKRRTCSSACARAWPYLRYALDPAYREAHQLVAARWIAQNPSKVTRSQHESALRALAGERSQRGRWMTKTGKPREFATQFGIRGPKRYIG